MRALLLVCALSVAGFGCGGDPAPTATGGAETAGASSPGATTPPRRPGAQDPQAPPTKTRVGFYDSEEAREAPFFELRTWTIGTPQPLAGVPYEVQWQTDEGPNIHKGTTDTDGLARAGLPTNAKIHRLLIKPGPTTAPLTVPVGQVLQPGRVLRVDAIVPPAGALLGVVLDENGAPVPNAEVVAFHAPLARVDEQGLEINTKASADESGRFALGGFPAGPFVLEAGLGDNVSVWRATGTLTEGQRVEGLEILVGAAHMVHGQVLGADGQPLAGARVVAGKKGRRTQSRPGPIPEISYVPTRQVVAMTGADGTFLLPAVPNLQEWNLNVEHPLHRRYLGVIEAGKTDVLVQLEAGLRIEGVVLDSEGTPVPRAALTLLGGQVVPITVNATRDGVFGIGGLEPAEGLWIVMAEPGFGPLLHGPLTVSDQPLTGLELRLPPAAALSGRAVDAAGRPVGGARVSLRRLDLPAGLPEEGLTPLALGRATVLTGEGGDFTFEELAPGSYELTATAPNGATARLEAVAAGAPPVELKFP